MRARARECIEALVGYTKHTEVAGGVRTSVRPSYNTSGKPRLEMAPEAISRRHLPPRV